MSALQDQFKALEDVQAMGVSVVPRLSGAARRALVAFSCFAAGIMLGRWLDEVHAPLWFAMASALLMVAGLMKGRWWVLLLGGSMVFLGGGVFSLKIYEVPRESLGLMIPEDEGANPGMMLRVQGVALTKLEKAQAPAGEFGSYVFYKLGASFRLKVEGVGGEVGGKKASGVLRVWMPAQGMPRVEVGDRVRVQGIARGLKGVMNPGEVSWKLWQAQSNECGRLTTRAGLVEVVGREESVTGRWMRFRAGLGERVEGLLDRALGSKAFDDESRAAISGLVLGERGPDQQELLGLFSRVGVGHLLAISGFHLAVLVMLVLWAVRLTGDHGQLEYWVVGLAVVLMLLVVPMRPPLMRAGVMVLGVLVGRAFGRRHDLLAILGWVGIVDLLLRPMDLWSPGFQLSFGLVGAMIWLGPTLHSRMFGSRLKGTVDRRGVLGEVLHRLGQLVTITVLCWLMALPIVAYHFGTVSLLGVLASLVLLGPVLIMLALGYLVLMVGVIVPMAGEWLGGLLGMLARWTISLVQWIDGLPGSAIMLPRISEVWSVVAVVVTIRWIGWGHRRSYGLWIMTLISAGWLVTQLTIETRLPTAEVLRIDTLAVGDGSCHLIRSGSEAMLIDCGSKRYWVGGQTIPRAVRALGAGPVSAVFITHANIDHYDGLVDAADRLGVQRVYIGTSLVEAKGAATVHFLERLREMDIETIVTGRGDAVTVGTARVTLLWPEKGEVLGDENNNSLVSFVEVQTDSGMKRVLLTGDIEGEAISQIRMMMPGLDVDVMQVPHHGSAKKAAMDFVLWANPQVVIQSTGPSRAGDSRWDHVRTGRRWLTTATDGAIHVVIQKDGQIVAGAMKRDE